MQLCQSSRSEARFADYSLDLRSGELRHKNGKIVRLPEQSFQILTILLEHPREVVSREEIRQRLWPDHTIVEFEHSISAAMNRLRQALGDSAEHPRFIETLPRRGYRFVVPTTQHKTTPIAAAEDAASLPNQRIVSAEEKYVSAELSSECRKITGVSKRRKLYAFGISLTLLALSFLLIYLSVPHTSNGSGSVLVHSRRSLAVLGFKSLSGRSDEAWLSTALSEMMTSEIAAGGTLRAIPGETVSQVKTSLALPETDSYGAKTLQRIRQNLGCDDLVLGSYLAMGNGRVRLDLKVEDAVTGELVDSVTEDGTESELGDLVSRAGAALRTKLGAGEVSPREAAEVKATLPANPEAAHLYAEGLARLRSFESLAARDLLQKAVSADAAFALGHSALARAWSDLGYDTKASDEARRAFDLSENLSRADRLLIEARYRETSRDWEKAAGIYHALFEFFPDNLEYGLALAKAEYKANKWKDALDAVAVLRKLPAPWCDDPRIDFAEEDAARSLGDAKRSEAALARAAEKAQAAGASLLLARARNGQAWLFENLGRFSEVEGLVREAKQLYTAANDRAAAAEATTIGAIALRNKGDYLGAKKGYEEGLALYRQIGNRRGQAGENDNIGDILVDLGDLEGARRAFEAAFSIYQEVGDQHGEALAENGLGDVYLALGNHRKAKEVYQSSVEICRRVGNPLREANALSGLGRIHRLEGNPEEALRDLTEARKKFEDFGDESEVGQVDLYLAELFLDKSNDEQAAMWARRAAEAYEGSKTPGGGAAANLLLARTLLANGRISQAREKVDQAARVASETHNRQLALSVAVASARIRASAGHPRDALAILKNLVDTAGGSTFAEQLYEARLAFGEIELKSADKSLGRSYLEALQKEASTQGFQLIAQKAAAVLGESWSQSARHPQN